MQNKVSWLILILAACLNGCVAPQTGNMRSEASQQLAAEWKDKYLLLQSAHEAEVTNLKRQLQELHKRNEELAASASIERRNKFILRTDDNEKAATDFVAFLKTHAFDVTRYGSELIRVGYGGGNFVIEPKVKKGGLSRVVVAKIYTIQPQYRRTTEILTYAVQLNQKLNVATFSLSDNFENFIMQSSITFVDELDVEEVRKFFEHLNTNVLAILVLMPETLKYLY